MLIDYKPYGSLSGDPMKTSLYVTLVALVSALSFSVQAIPPVPPSPIKTAKEAQITCKDLNALTVEEIEMLNEDPERIVHVDLDLREVCFK